VNITLSPDQQVALDTLLNLIENPLRSDLVLAGAAGCGKTTLMRKLIGIVEGQMGRHCTLLAPTGKAAYRLAEVTGRSTSTIHQALYPRVTRNPLTGKPEFHQPGGICERGQLAVVDEASMVSRKLYQDIHENLPPRALVLYVGDSEQLMPVDPTADPGENTWGPAMEEPDARLTKVHRQEEGNPILAYATAIREGWGNEWSREYAHDSERLQVYSGYESAMHWTLDQYKAGYDATVLTYTNKMRKRLNQDIRKGLGYHRQGVIVPGDRLLVRVNNHDLQIMNGEVLTVEDVEDARSDLCSDAKVVHTERGSFLVNMDFFNGNKSQYIEWKQKFARRDPVWVHCDHGFALTIHASQGSEWERVCVVIDSAVMRIGRERPDEGRRMVYTAVTRARDQLAVIRGV
jgi:exodeoxyribonuclease V alpha subunit